MLNYYSLSFLILFLMSGRVAQAQDATAAPAQSGGAGFTQLLSGQTAPLSLTLKDLGSDWRRMSVAGQFDYGNVFSSIFGAFGGGGAAAPSGTSYYTKGQTVALGGETYLIAYRVVGKPVNFMALIGQLGNKGADALPKPAPLTADTALSLSLLNLRTSGSFNDIRAFSLDTEIAESKAAIAAAPGNNAANPVAPDAPAIAVGEVNAVPADSGSADSRIAASSSNLKQIGLGALMYVQDYDEKFPPMTSISGVKSRLMPYLKDKAAFVSPIDNKPYLPNHSLHQKLMAAIARPAATVLFYEQTVGSDGLRGVCYVDGHVKRIPEADFQRLKNSRQIT